MSGPRTADRPDGQPRTHSAAGSATTADPELAALHDELRGYPCDQPEPRVETPGAGDVVTPLRLRDDRGDLVFLSTIATLGTPADITVAELAIESFFPAAPPMSVDDLLVPFDAVWHVARTPGSLEVEPSGAVW